MTVKAESEHHTPDRSHPSTFFPATFALLIVLAIFGAIIGIQLILQLGVTPNTSIIGALVAMILARIPLTLFVRYRSVHVQNLAQSNISAATFGAANSLLVPIGIPFLLGRGELILPMWAGASLAMLLDGYLLYRMFDTKVFPASGTWPPRIAAAARAGIRWEFQPRDSAQRSPGVPSNRDHGFWTIDPSAGGKPPARDTSVPAHCRSASPQHLNLVVDCFQ
jgi:uncharacterized oligopeptide transporter (OPT) family protein